MALVIRGFAPDYTRAIRQALSLITGRLTHPPGPMPGDLRTELRAIISGRRPTVDLVYGGDQGVCAVPYSRSAGYRVLLCKRTFMPENDGHPRLPAVLFHELIHIARGWELDAEAFENAWFSPAEGGRPPTRNDWRLFKQQDYQGWWVHMDPQTRRVTDYADRHILTFPAPE